VGRPGYTGRILVDTSQIVMHESSRHLMEWYARQKRSTHALLVGLAVGIIGGLIGLLLAVAGPVITTGAIIGVLAGLFILTDVSAALYGLIAVAVLLPFGTLPFKVVITPTLLDIATCGFLLVYLFQCMTVRRHRL